MPKTLDSPRFWVIKKCEPQFSIETKAPPKDLLLPKPELMEFMPKVDPQLNPYLGLSSERGDLICRVFLLEARYQLWRKKNNSEALLLSPLLELPGRKQTPNSWPCLRAEEFEPCVDNRTSHLRAGFRRVGFSSWPVFIETMEKKGPETEPKKAQMWKKIWDPHWAVLCMHSENPSIFPRFLGSMLTFQKANFAGEVLIGRKPSNVLGQTKSKIWRCAYCTRRDLRTGKRETHTCQEQNTLRVKPTRANKQGGVRIVCHSKQNASPELSPSTA